MARNSPDRINPSDGRLDLQKLDLAAKPKRKRRARNRPAPAKELVEGQAKAEARAFARNYPPGIILEPAGFDKEFWTSPHSDVGLWHLQLADAFGTRSNAVVTLFIDQLQGLVSDSHWDDEARQWRIDETHLSAILALVSTIKPRDEMEAALAAQMVAVHLMTMKVAGRAMKYDYEIQTAAVAAKLARAFAMQMAALRANRIKRTTARQSIKVKKELHQHVHYHSDRGDRKTDDQPLAMRLARAREQPALRSADAIGPALPSVASDGEAAVQDARRG